MFCPSIQLWLAQTLEFVWGQKWTLQIDKAPEIKVTHLVRPAGQLCALVDSPLPVSCPLLVGRRLSGG